MSSSSNSVHRHTHSNDDLLECAPHEFVRPISIKHAIWTAPQNILIAFLKIYRALVSPFYGNVCKYYPSCSAYSLEAITVHGACKGLSLTVRRLLRCHPWATGGIDEVPSGARTFVQGQEPKIILLNHPHIAQ